MEKQTHQTRIGEGTICPIMSWDDLDIHCSDACQWHDGDGCAIWRIVKALESIVTLNMQKAPWSNK
jgi:hypothetical protein